MTDINTSDKYYQQFFNKGYYIEITNITADNNSVIFKPYILKFSDNYKSDWNQEYVMGRMDAIATFRRTTRIIQLSFAVPSENYNESVQNWNMVKRLKTFLYPTYKVLKSSNVNNTATSLEDVQNVNGNLKRYYKAQKYLNTLESQLDLKNETAIMTGNPILSLKFANLICDENKRPLYGYLDGLVVEPDSQMGYHTQGEGVLIPKSFELNFSFTVIHTEPLGFDQEGNLRSK